MCEGVNNQLFTLFFGAKIDLRFLPNLIQYDYEY